jgi:hypothetical protein
MRLVTLALVVAALAAGCDKPTDANIDKWMHTQQGPEKLRKALADESLAPELSAHAAANLIRTGAEPDVRTALAAMAPPRRVAVIGELAPKLWELARVEDDMKLPDPAQVQGKDALYGIRQWANPAERQKIDGYLTDWYCVGSYVGRAQVGAVLGATVIRAIGPAAGKKLMGVTDGVIAAPGQEKVKNRIDDELLLGLAASGAPEAVKYVLDLAQMDRGDKTLSTRSMHALYQAYVDPEGLFDAVDPSALAPNVDELVKIAEDDQMPNDAANDAIDLIRTVGMPKCKPALLGMIPHPRANTRFKYSVAEKALHCAGTPAIGDVVRALPDGAYAKDELDGAVAVVIAAMQPRAEVLAQVRPLLDDKRPLVRWVAIETLAAMKSTEDAARIAGVKGSERLVGYWGDQSDVDPKDRKPDPTLGERAKELAGQLSGTPK